MTPVEAFQLLLRSGYPQRPALADEIYGYEWFHWKTEREKASEDFKAALAASKKLSAAIKSGDIRVVGSLKNDQPPLEVPRADIEIGQLDIWEGQFECSKPRAVDRIYKAVFLHEDDVRAIANGAKPKKAKKAKKKRDHQQEVALPILKRLFGDSLPGRDSLPDVRLAKLVQDELGTQNTVSKETILRAAGRKKSKSGK